ncbi:stage II sporulation protein M [Thermoproteota archaeon]
MEEQSPGIMVNIRNLSWRQWKRVFLLMLLFVLIMIAIGSSSPLSENQSSDILREFENNLPEIDTQPIFTNNFIIASIMVIPIFGIAIGVMILYTTGVIIAATGMSVNIPGILLLLSLLVFPFSWLEFLSYAAAMTQSIFLVLGLFRKHLKKELIRTAFLLITIFIMLFVAAFIETVLINLL